LYVWIRDEGNWMTLGKYTLWTWGLKKLRPSCPDETESTLMLQGQYRMTQIGWEIGLLGLDTWILCCWKALLQFRGAC
jgi:hypothetical protein